MRRKEKTSGSGEKSTLTLRLGLEMPMILCDLLSASLGGVAPHTFVSDVLGWPWQLAGRRVC